MHDDHTPAEPLLVTRGYQREMLNQSLRRNTIIALDTGSGKTHIAVLRLKHEMEKEAIKHAWFIAPTVSLCAQQHAVLKKHISLNIGLISGANEPNQWKNAGLWQNFLSTHRIVVSTPQVLLDALRHGYIVMGRDVCLIVFDEAHHAKDNNPYNKIMQEFYFNLPPRQEIDSSGMVRPMILGLSASPIYGGDVERDLRSIEKNLDCIICTPCLHRSELAQYVHRPTFRHVLYRPPNDPFSTNLASLQAVQQRLNVEDDPLVIDLRRKLAKSTTGSAESRKLDQRLSKVINKEDSFTHKGLRDCVNTARDICFDLGEWAADWFIFKVIEHAKQAANPRNNFMASWRHSEKAYLLRVLDKAASNPISYFPDDIEAGCADKVNVLITCLLTEMAEAQSLNEPYSGLIFVERRDTVLALAEVLKHHPRLQNLPLKVGMLLGTSDSSRRHSMMDITRTLVKQSQDDTLDAFRDGEINLIVSTAVAEEGIDIQACGSVIRWDLPQNMKSWVQSRGRARKKRSTFTVMYEDLAGSKQQNAMTKWIEEERQMLESIYDQSRTAKFRDDDRVSVEDGDGEEEDRAFEVPLTGAKLTLHSAISHLTHFCAKIPNSTHVDTRPFFDRDPPEFPDGWHSSQTHGVALYQGPYGSTVTLPLALPLPQRRFTVERKFKTVTSAHRHAAYIAYKTLYDNDLLNQNLLPIESVVEPRLEEEVKAMLADVEKREGLANVTIGIDPWLPNDGRSTNWFCSGLTIEGLPPLFLFTRSEIIPFNSDQGPVVYPPGRTPARTTLHPVAIVSAIDPKIAKARDFTRRIFWGFNASRMDWDNLDFAYLFLPVQEFSTVWDSRRAWLDDKRSANPELYPDRLMVKASRFVKEFGFVEDLTLVQRQFGRTCEFSGWRYDALKSEEEERVRLRCGKFLDKTAIITYPLMVVKPCRPRTNMLFPSRSAKSGTKDKRDAPAQYLIPEHSMIILVSNEETEYAYLLPSVLRGLSSMMTANSLRRNLFASTALRDIPLSMLTVAITAPSANDGVNYQRLETLGDAILKFVVGIQLLAEYPLWHEGYLSRKKDHAVANVRLAKEDIRRRLYRWLIRDVMLGRKWKPKYFSPNVIDVDERMSDAQEVPPHDATQSVSPGEPVKAQKGKKGKKGKSKGSQLSTKVLADVVESVIGAAYSHGGLSLAYECAKYFDLGLQWKPISTRIDQILARSDTLTREQPSITFPTQLEDVERMLGYTFKQKLFLVEALTHASYQSENNLTTSYERMEFLGDSILDLIVNDYLFHAPGKNYSPGHIYQRKIAMVNMHFLAYICLNTKMTKLAFVPMPNPVTGTIEERFEEEEICLFNCLLHTSTRILDDQVNAYARYKKTRTEIGRALTEGNTYPWAALTRLQAPKFFSDMIESLIGAVYVDSRGDLDIIQTVVKRIGIMRVLEHIVEDDVDVLHPVSRLTLWTQKTGQKLEYIHERAQGMAICRVFVEGTELEGARASDVFRGKVSQEEVKFAAAEAAIKELRLRDVGVRYETLKHKRTGAKKKKPKGKEKSDERQICAWELDTP